MSASTPETSIHSVKFSSLCSCTFALDINCSMVTFVSWSQSEDVAGEKTQDFHILGGPVSLALVFT